MSGVGISGLIANLPGTVTPYPTQDPNLELGGYRQVVDATARDAIPAAFRALGMLVTLQSTGVTYQLFGGLTNANWIVYNPPFKGTYYVDPTFIGPQTGSSANPFTSITSAFAFAAALGVTNGVIWLAPGANTIENVTFPTTGEWEIATQPGQGSLTTFITGNVDCSAIASARRAFTNIRIIGNLSGNCSAGTQRILFAGTLITGTVNLTITGAGIQRVATRSGTSAAAAGGNVQSCNFNGAVVIAGTFWGSDAIFSTSLAVTATSSFSFCDMPPTTTTSGGAISLFLTNCSNAVGGSLAFTASSGSMLLRPDGPTLSEFYRVGLVLTGAVTSKGLIGQGSSRSAQVSNVGVTPLCGITPASLMVVEACLTLLANGGTAVGAAVLNVVYTDMTGTLVTEAVTLALNVAGALGTKSRGSLVFSQNGASVVSFSVTGITVATGLSYQCDVSIRQAS